MELMLNFDERVLVVRFKTHTLRMEQVPLFTEYLEESLKDLCSKWQEEQS